MALVHDLADDEAALCSDIIAQLTGADPQVIDGELRAYDDQADRLDFIVRSVSGDEWDIEARRSDELDQIAAQLAAWHPVPHPLLQVPIARTRRIETASVIASYLVIGAGRRCEVGEGCRP